MGIKELSMPKLFRVILPVTDINRAEDFYRTVLKMPGKRISPGRHYFDCEGTILACYEPKADGDAVKIQPNPEHVYIAVKNLEETFALVKAAGCGKLDATIQTLPWGERSFYIHDPFGNPVCFVDEKTAFQG
jgi:predicted enzyme related to lactoylglutathione lyase